jgi:Uma2 family endonuclease
MRSTVGLVTVEEFRALPEDPGVLRELRDGEVVELTRPKKLHWHLQNRLDRILAPALEAHGVVGTEFAFRPEMEYQVWAADVAFVRHERYDAIGLDDNLQGSPDLVVEIESPSNSAVEFERREEMCLRTGCREFWIVYPELKRVRVSTGSAVKRYELGDVIELTVVNGVKVAVADIFGPS